MWYNIFLPACRLVDSRDIVELQLKQFDCEVMIRKKEALPQPPPPAAIPMPYAPPPSVAQSVPPPVPAALPAPASPVSSLPSSTPAAKSAKSSLPPLKCPMAGTFYRSPGPGEPPFVKVSLLEWLCCNFLFDCLGAYLWGSSYRLEIKCRKDKSCASLRP